ncbi:MAG: DNA polymerase III subunit alpha [Mollicutes bacterium]|nr:DNA polymerase III subunit alpha [Mollicutes bacterium]
MLIPIKVITEYSLLKSLIKIDDLIKVLIEKNIKICGICDDELYGSIEFYLKCKNNNIKPLIGMEIKIEDHTVYLYAKNYIGYQKLIAINYEKESLLLKDIIDDNILVVLPNKEINLYQEFENKDNIYISYNTNDEKKVALILTDKIVYLNNIRCLFKEDIKYIDYLKLLGKSFEHSDNDYLNDRISKDDYEYLLEFSNHINIEIPFDKRYIPVYRKNINSFIYLSKLAQTGLEKRLNNKVNKRYQKRLEEELKIIKEMNFVDYFLIVYDYVLYAKKNNILVGPGRGSAAGSLVSYSVGITDIDPIEYDLSFARFLNPYRNKMPDIDIDFEDSKRGEVTNYVKEKYGDDFVALGLTFNTYKARLILRDLAKVFKIDIYLFNKFIKCIDNRKSLKTNKEEDVVHRYLRMYSELNELYDVAMHLENLKKNISTHAAGVVISSVPLKNIIPIIKDDVINRTGITMDYLEKLGLLKMDFLALKNLTTIKNIIEKIPNISFDNIPLDDKKTYELFKNGETNDIFQFESNYAKKTLIKIKPSSFEELSIAMALVRPGPSNQIDLYVNNKEKGKIDVHDSLKDILKSTWGVIIYQEQVMRILVKIAGYTEYEADNIRNAISKKKEDIIIKEEENFIAKGIKNGYDKEFLNDLFNQIKRFAEYGFNKAHSVSYSLISYRLAYLKANYPVYFYISLLSETKDDLKRKYYLNELKKSGIKILKPNINKSHNDFQFKNNYLLLPFNMIKGLNENIINEIINNREEEYLDIYDFLIKNKSIINDNIYEILVRSSVFFSFKITNKALIEKKYEIFNYASLEDLSFDKPIIDVKDEYDDKTLLKDEIKYYGTYLGNHPVSIYTKVVKAKDTIKYLFKNIKMALLIEKITIITTKKGDNMAFVVASDETGIVELTLFPEVFETVSDLKENEIIFIEGKSSKRFDKYQIIVNNIKRR